MGLRINNYSALAAQNQLTKTTKAFQRALERLSTGRRINSARDDAVGLSIGVRLDAQIRGMSQAIRNINEALGFVATADGAMQSQMDIVQRMRELAFTAANGSLSSAERSNLDQEFQSLYAEFNHLTEQTSFNDTTLLDGNFGTKTLQVGANTGQTIDLVLPSLEASAVFTQSQTVGSGTFESRTTTETGNNPYAVFIKDLNGDGNLDLLSSDVNDAVISVSMGNGNGTFGARVTYYTADTNYNFRVQDINADGILDLITPDYFSNHVSIFAGNGDGSFASRVTIALGSRPRSIEIEDLNGDGRLDIVSADMVDNTLSILLGNGDGTFNTRMTLQTGNNPPKVTVGDFNKDGKWDLISSDIGAASVFLGNGNGTFQARTTIFAFYNAWADSGDLNGDGVDDLVWASSGIAINLGNGNGTFQATKTINMGSTVRNVSLRDLNNDGYLEILTGDWGTDTVSIALGNGNGTFQLPTTIPTDLDPISIDSGDVNGDGVHDLVVANDNSNTISTFIGIGTSRSIDPAMTIATQSEAIDMIQVLENAIQYISNSRASVSAIHSRLDFARMHAETLAENSSTARSQLLDTNFALEIAELVHLQILQQADVAVLSQANLNLSLILKLFEPLA